MDTIRNDVIACVRGIGTDSLAWYGYPSPVLATSKAWSVL